MPEMTPIRFGKYLLSEKIGAGGMAQLYRAKMTGFQGLEKIIAVKKILPHLYGERDLAKALIEEAKLAASLDHPSIVQIYDFGTIEGSCFIAMEYILGWDLRCIFQKAMEKGTPLSFGNALFIVSQICSALGYAHKMTDKQGNPLNILHRDLNPQNVLVTHEGEVKIVDFGIARAATQSPVTKHEMFKRKVAYTSPEQALGEKIDLRSDIFLTGALFYEMLTQKPLFAGETLQVLSKVRRGEFEPPEVAVAGLPDKLCEILHRALAKEIDQRYQSCGEMLADIEECMSQLPSRPTAESLRVYTVELFGEKMETQDLVQATGDPASVRPQERAAPDPATPLEDPPPAAPLPLMSPAAPLPLMDSAPERFEPESPEPVDLHAKMELGNDLETVEEILRRARSSLEGENTLLRRRKGLIYSTLVTVAALAAITLGWTFWPREKSWSAHDRETPPPSLSAPSKETAAVKMALPRGDQEQRKIVDPSLEAKALQAKAISLVEKNPKEAKSLLLKAVELNPRSITAHFHLGLTYTTLENFPEAIEAYQKVIELDPGFVDAYFNLGYIYALNGRYPKAEEMYTQVVKLAPPYLDEALYNLGLVQEKQGKKKQSMENLERAFQTNPKNERAQKLLRKLKADL